MASVLDEAIATGSVRNGRLVFHNRRAFDAQIAMLKEGLTVEITVRKLLANRSSQANRFYWGVVVHAISEHTGYQPEEVHELLKQKFVPRRLAVLDVDGNVKDEFVMGARTRTMDTATFSAYVERCRQWAAEDLGLYIPDATEVVC